MSDTGTRWGIDETAAGTCLRSRVSPDFKAYCIEPEFCAGGVRHDFWSGLGPRFRARLCAFAVAGEEFREASGCDGGYG